MKYPARLWLLITIGGFFLFLDQLLKWLALNIWSSPSLITAFFGWQPFINRGVAFGINLPSWAIFFVSIPVLVIIGSAAINERKKQNPRAFFAWSLLFAGAFSNFFDRLVYNNVIDYFLIGMSLFNLADAMIVLGLGMAIFYGWKKKL